MKASRSIVFPLVFAAALLLCSCAGARVKEYRVEVVKEFPHSRASFTQGLFFDGGKLYESVGQYGESAFMEVDLSSGEAVRRVDFAKKYFVEGSVMLDGKLYILTWTNRVAFVYDASGLKYEATYSYPREGWGLTTDGKSLIASDGSANLYFMDKTFNVRKRVTVKMNGRPMRFLNELEYIDGKIWANLYTSDLILIIDPDSGAVEATVDCSGLLPDSLRDASTDVLNGIACDGTDYYLTGKCWPRLYQVRLVQKK